MASRSSTSGFLPWIVWGLGCLFYFYEFLLQVSPGIMASELMHDFAITSQILGVLSGIYYYSYSPMQLPCGILVDYYGPHRILTMATAICALSTIAFGLTNSLTVAFISRFMIGFGSSFAVVCCLKFAANWFDAGRFSLLTGLMVACGMFGAIGGEAPLALLVDHFGWRHSLLILGGLGILLALCIYIWAQDKPKMSSQTRSEKVVSEPIIYGLIKLVKNYQLWMVAIYGGLMYMATPVFCGLWGVPFLMLKMKLSKAAAANLISLVFVGWAIASPLWGLYSNRIGLRKPSMYIASVGALVTLALFIYFPVGHGFLLKMLLFSFGVFSAGFLTAFSIAKEVCNKNYVATGLGFMNMLNMVGVAIAQPMIGLVLDKQWDGAMLNGARLYPLKAYYIGLSILPIGMVLAFLLLPFIKETYCRHIDV